MKARFLNLLLIATLITSCSNNNNDDLVTNAGQAATSGTWRVTLFTDSGNNETSDYTGYNFTFNTDGTLIVVKGAVTKTGTWSFISSSSKFNIDLGPKLDANKPFGELTDDWKIISTSPTEIRLSDDNSSSNEQLTFTKN